MRERRICTLCHGDRCVVVGVQHVTMCPRCSGDGVELLELAAPLPANTKQLVFWYQLDLPFDASSTPDDESLVRESAQKPRRPPGRDTVRSRRAALMASLAPAARTGGVDPGPLSKACVGRPGGVCGQLDDDR